MSDRSISGVGDTRSRLDAMTSENVQPGANLLLVPLGATEQHGPHLPIGTDTCVASAWADRIADELNHRGVQATVAPALPYGSSGEHQMFPGTLSIGQEALELVLVELIRSASADFPRIVLLSGHAGNVEPVTRAVNKMVAEGHDVRQFFPAWPADKFADVDAHAGRTETSLMLFLAPDRVLNDRVEPGQTAPLSEVLGPMMTGGVGAVSENGILGDPTGASPEEGQRLFDALVERTIATLLHDGSPSAE